MLNLININNPTVSLTASSTTSSVALPAHVSSHILIDNSFAGALDCYVKSGLSDVVAAVTDLHIACNEKATYEIDPSHTHVAAITSTGTTVLKLVKGNGV